MEASKFKLNYIKLDGTIACMVNGAGLAMATMDIIKLSGGSPANFLDVGGGASEEQVKNAFRLLLSDPNVKAVFVNIFGGILRCDVLASGVVNAAKELKIKVPVIVRMEGTNVQQGQAILKNSGLNFTIAQGMKDGAEKAVALSPRKVTIVGSPRNGPMPHNGFRPFDPAATFTAFPGFRYTPLEAGLARAQHQEFG